MANPKISVYSLADLKNTSDDAIPNYLNSLKFKQSHTLSDVRLALGYSAFLISAATFAWDYKSGFEDTKYYTAVAVFLYALLNGALTYWSWAVEKGVIYSGTSPNGEKIQITTTTTKNIPLYNLTITFHPTPTSTPTTITLSKPFSAWFDASGNFIPIPFQQMFASSVPVIGIVDPSKVVVPSTSTMITTGNTSSVSEVKKDSGEVLDWDVIDAVAAAAAASGSGAGGKGSEGGVVSTSAGKKGKGRKKG